MSKISLKSENELQLIVKQHERFTEEFQKKYEKVELLIQKMEKEFNYYYKKPSEKIIDSKFKDKITFCLDVYQHCIKDLTYDFGEIGLGSLPQILQELVYGINKKILFILQSFEKYIEYIGMNDNIDLESYQKQKRISKQRAPSQQHGITNLEFIKLMRSNEDEETKKEKMKKFFDPMVLEFQESIDVIDEVLKNKLQMMSLQPTKISEHLSKALQDINAKLQVEIQGFEDFPQHEKEVLFYIKYFSSGYVVKQLTDEIQKQVNQKTNDSFKKVLKQVIQGNKQAKEQYIQEKEIQTDTSMADLEKINLEFKQKIKELQENVSYLQETNKELEYDKLNLKSDQKLKQKYENDLQQLQDHQKNSNKEVLKLRQQVQQLSQQVYDLQQEKGGKVGIQKEKNVQNQEENQHQQQQTFSQYPSLKMDQTNYSSQSKKFDLLDKSVQCVLIENEARSQNSQINFYNSEEEGQNTDINNEYSPDNLKQQQYKKQQRQRQKKSQQSIQSQQSSVNEKGSRVRSQTQQEIKSQSKEKQIKREYYFEDEEDNPQTENLDKILKNQDQQMVQMEKLKLEDSEQNEQFFSRIADLIDNSKPAILKDFPNRQLNAKNQLKKAIKKLGEIYIHQNQLNANQNLSKINQFCEQSLQLYKQQFGRNIVIQKGNQDQNSSSNKKNNPNQRFQTPDTKKRIIEDKIQEQIYYRQNEDNSKKGFKQLNEKLFENVLLKNIDQANQNSQNPKKMTNDNSLQKIVQEQYIFPFEDSTKKIIVQIPNQVEQQHVKLQKIDEPSQIKKDAIQFDINLFRSLETQQQEEFMQSLYLFLNQDPHHMQQFFNLIENNKQEFQQTQEVKIPKIYPFRSIEHFKPSENHQMQNNNQTLQNQQILKFYEEITNPQFVDQFQMVIDQHKDCPNGCFHLRQFFEKAKFFSYLMDLQIQDQQRVLKNLNNNNRHRSLSNKDKFPKIIKNQKF